MATKAKEVESKGKGAWSDPVAAPIIADGFVEKATDTVIEGVVLGRSEGQYGPYYTIRINANTQAMVKVGDNQAKAATEGMVVNLSEVNALRPLADIVKKGPTAVRIIFKGKGDKEEWLLDFRHRPAF
jgi:hypothetical protein